MNEKTTATQAQMMKKIRYTARRNGLLFKAQDEKINGRKVYSFINRRTKKVIDDNYSLNLAYASEKCGFIEQLQII